MELNTCQKCGKVTVMVKKNEFDDPSGYYKSITYSLHCSKCGKIIELENEEKIKIIKEYLMSKRS